MVLLFTELCPFVIFSNRYCVQSIISKPLKAFSEHLFRYFGENYYEYKACLDNMKKTKAITTSTFYGFVPICNFNMEIVSAV